MKKRYDSYKPSGIDWIGDVPEHWVNTRIKFNILRSAAGVWGDDEKGDENDIVCFRIADFDYDERCLSTEKITIRNIESKQLEGRYLSKGDLLIEKSGGGESTPVGRVVYCNYNGKATYTNFIHSITLSDSVDSRFFLYYFNMLYSNKVNLLFFNQTTGLQNLQVSDYLGQSICLPPLSEQQAIAAWLDEKCGEIDAAIAKVDREIELIDELKQSEISRVVTRGLNPDTPLRPSGIDWIGNIPEHWAIRKVAQIFHGIGSGTTPTSGSNKYYSEDGVNWLQTGDLNDGNINDTSKKITTTALIDFSSLKIYPKGSIVIAMYGATIGKLGKLNIETTTNQACCVLPKSNEIDNDFAFYVFWAGKRALINSAYGGGQPNISQDTIKSFKFALPPLSEQQAIADYLDKKCAEIDGLKAKLSKKRETLTELRQSIISEVVTGKRKVI